MSKKKVKIKVTKIEKSSVNIPIIKKYKEDVEEIAEEPVRERQGEFCEDCDKKRDTKKGKDGIFRCVTCQDEFIESEREQYG